MMTKPFYSFGSGNETGIDTVPLKSMFQLENKTTPRYFFLLSKDNVTSSMTAGDFILNYKDDYLEIETLYDVSYDESTDSVIINRDIPPIVDLHASTTLTSAVQITFSRNGAERQDLYLINGTLVATDIESGYIYSTPESDVDISVELYVVSIDLNGNETMSNTSVGIALPVLFKINITTTDTHGYIDFTYTGDQILILDEATGDAVAFIENIPGEIQIYPGTGVQSYSLISGSVDKFRFSDITGRHDITEVHVVKASTVLNFSYFCNELEYLTTLTWIDGTCNATDMSYAWQGCALLTACPYVDTSKAINMNYTWSGCTTMTSIDLHTDALASCLNPYFTWEYCKVLESFPFIETSHITTLNGTWQYCQALISFPLIDTSSATLMRQTWGRCIKLESFPAIDTSSGVSMGHTAAAGGVWNTCSSLKTFPWIDTSNASTLASAWYGCESLTSFPLIDTSGIATMANVWYSCRSLEALPEIDISSATNIGGMLGWCVNIPTLHVLDTSSVTLMYTAFAGMSKLSSFPTIDTSNATNIGAAFNCLNGLTSFPDLDYSSVTTIVSGWGTARGSGGAFAWNHTLQHIPDIDFSGVTGANQSFRNIAAMKRPPNVTFGTLTNVDSMYAYSDFMEIPDRDMTSVTNFEDFIFATKNLKTIPNFDMSNGENFKYFAKNSGLLMIDDFNTGSNPRELIESFGQTYFWYTSSSQNTSTRPLVHINSLNSIGMTSGTNMFEKQQGLIDPDATAQTAILGGTNYASSIPLPPFCAIIEAEIGNFVITSGSGVIDIVDYGDIYYGENLYMVSSTSAITDIQFTDSNDGILKLIILKGDSLIDLTDFVKETNLTEVTWNGDCNVTNFTDAFRDCANLNFIDIEMNSGTIFNNAFNGCTELRFINSIDSTAATDVTDMFTGTTVARPNATERAAIIGSGGDAWENSLPTPYRGYIELITSKPGVAWCLYDVGDTYVEHGAYAFSIFDGDITGSIVIDDSALNMAVAGTYRVYYTVEDSAGILQYGTPYRNVVVV